MESVYLGSILTAGLTLSLIVNGAVASGVFAAILVWVWGKEEPRGESQSARLAMRPREWVGKIVGAGAIYLVLFMLVGLDIYIPLARVLDPAALASEQSAVASSAVLIFPLETFRGALWALFGIPAIVAMRFGWKKTAVVTGLLFAVPMSGNILLSTAMAPGLQVAHLAEVFVENLFFGLMVVWILHLRSRLSPVSVGS